MKTKLYGFSQDFEHPYEKPYQHLEPLTDALIKAGNEPTRKSIWYLTRDGWRSDFKLPLDFDLLEQLFEIPTTIQFLRDRDSIFCQNSWSQIRGAIGDERE